MLTSLTSDLGFWIIFSTVLISIGTYKLLTKQNADANLQNSQQIKALGEKIDGFSFEIRLEQVRAHENLKNITEKVNRIENDTTAMRAQSGVFSESIAKIKVKMENLEKGERKDEFD